jgi:hypothetical protein
MATVEIHSGVCGHVTTVTATGGDSYRVHVRLESTCPHVWKISGDLDEVDALQQIGLRDGLPPVLQSAYTHCVHAACPVPSGLVKAIEVAAGLALPEDVSMRFSKEG